MEAPLELIVAVYDDEERAREVLDEVKDAVKGGSVEIKNAAVLVKDEDGKVHIDETEDVDAGRGALFGAITGGLIGLLAGPAGAIAGAVAGAATGGVTAAMIDMGFADDQLKELQHSMPPSSSAVVVLLEHTWVEKLVDELEEHRGKMFRHEVNPRIADQYRR